VSEFISATAPAGFARRLALAAFALVLGSLLASATANAAPTHATTTTVACPQTQVFPTEVSNCTITVVDNAAGATAPTGEVHLATVALPFITQVGVVRPGTCTLAPVNANSSSCAAFWTPLKGENSFAKIAGVYTGDATHITSRGESALLEGLLRHESVTKVTCSNSQPALGSTVNCEASVRTKDNTRTATVPTGEIEFSFADLEVGEGDGKVPLEITPRDCVLVAAGNESHCSATVKILKAGTQEVRAVYAEDPSHETSSAGFDFHIAEPGKHATRATTSCPAKAKAGSTVTCGFFVQDLGPNATTPTGKIVAVALNGSFGGEVVRSCNLAFVTANARGCFISYTMPVSGGSVGDLIAHYRSDATHTKAETGALIEIEF
jgi:hypothetical protein